jgi:LacI family transcriptional regulator
VVSITDVAKKADVSITTVSRVLSGSSHPVSEETRARVLEAAEALNYSPSALAKAMVTRATHIVGVIIGDATDPYFASIVRGIEDVAREQGYLVIICNSDRVPQIELQYLDIFNGAGRSVSRSPNICFRLLPCFLTMNKWLKMRSIIW